MKTRLFHLGAAAVLAAAAGVPAQVPEPLEAELAAPADAAPGWRLGAQAYTFNRFTFFEAVDKTAAAGLAWIEAYPGQALARELPGARFHHAMPAAHREEVRGKLRAAGVRLVNYGVVGLPPDEAECRRVFAFAREMGIETLVAEPPPEALDLVERLAVETGLEVAIHNHPEPSRYWHPERVAEALKGRSPLLGACADTGHWMRSGVPPREGLKLLAGRIHCLHFKDLNEFGRRDAHDVVWGTGKADAAVLLADLKAQGFRGVFSIEYEHNWESSLPEVRACAAWFDRTAATLLPGGWRPLLAGGLADGIFPPGSWTWTEGVLARQGGGDLWTRARYGDFALALEFKVEKGVNSGVFLRTGSLENWLHTAIEVQLLDSFGVATPGKHDCGAIFDILEPAKNAVRAPGAWNQLRVVARGGRILVGLNGEKVIDLDLDRWTTAGRNPDGTPNKFAAAYRDMPRQGHLGFQDHGGPVWFRNLRIKELAPAPAATRPAAK